ncbi:MFS transporter [Novosphingobium sp.]|uniref:MFS transporter n=1 Tax=Novosphingobium sp. TaxID=1874826 RepID=UPI003015E610
MPPMLLTPLRRLYLHSGLQSFVEAGGGIFVAGFLVSRGFSFPAALASFALIVLSRLALRGLVLPLALRAGLRSVLLTGIAVRAASFVMLPFVHDVGPLLALFLAVSGLGSVLYWTAWHAFLPALTETGRGGQQVSVQQATSALVGIAAPAMGGLLLAHGGPDMAFAMIALLQLASALPLLGAPNPAIDPDAVLEPGVASYARRLYFNEGFHSGCAVVIWNLALFATLGEHFDQFGAAMAAAGVAAAAGSLIVGRLIDGGRPRHSLVIAYGAAALALAAKGTALGHPLLAVAATALGALVVPMTSTAMLAPLYAMARQGPCLLRFSMASEGGWDLGCASASLTAAALLALGAGFRLPILLGLAAIAAMAWMLDRWYARRPQAA